MTHVNEQLERLISRRLDGELTADEQLELDRELLRNPAARQMLEQYAAIDTLAAEVLRDCAARRQAPRLVVPAPESQPAASRPAAHHRGGRWMLVGSALAACLALVVFLQTPPARDANLQSPTPVSNNSLANNVKHTGNSHAMIPTVGTNPIGSNPAMQTLQPSEGGIWTVSAQSPRELDRVTQRNRLLITDKSGNLYLIDVDHVREVERDGDELDYTKNPI
ncbi:MAG: hypothetical protein H6817_07590 [Phycisphaerales bacterium]|nr:hypothetical protein [Phycisphaerales bacterium]